jgi:hypothetical protein
MIITPLSLSYHHSYEKPGSIAQVEGIAAKVAFLIGLSQVSVRFRVRGLVLGLASQLGLGLGLGLEQDEGIAAKVAFLIGLSQVSVRFRVRRLWG